MCIRDRYHDAMGALVMSHGGTLEHFAGDGMMVYFNDPVEVENPALVAVEMAIDMQARFSHLVQNWLRRGYALSICLLSTSDAADDGSRADLRATCTHTKKYFQLAPFSFFFLVLKCC